MSEVYTVESVPKVGATIKDFSFVTLENLKKDVITNVNNSTPVTTILNRIIGIATNIKNTDGEIMGDFHLVAEIENFEVLGMVYLPVPIESSELPAELIDVVHILKFLVKVNAEEEQMTFDFTYQ